MLVNASGTMGGMVGDSVGTDPQQGSHPLRGTEAIAAARLSGAEFDDVVISKDPQFVRFSMEVANNLPAWRWLRPAGEPHASDFWQQRPDGRLVVSERSLDVLRRFNLNHAEVVGVD